MRYLCGIGIMIIISLSIFFSQKSVCCLTLLSGGYFASCGYDGIKIYDWEDFEQINHLSEDRIDSCKQLKDGRIVSTILNDHIVTIWNYVK
jgi:WD40 repeat protein